MKWREYWSFIVFLDMFSRQGNKKEKINWIGSHQIKGFFSMKKTINKMNGEDICIPYIHSYDGQSIQRTDIIYYLKSNNLQFLKRRNWIGIYPKQTYRWLWYEKRQLISLTRGNANQNTNETSPHLSRNAYY